MVLACWGAGGVPPVRAAPPEGARLKKPAGRPSSWGEMLVLGRRCAAAEGLDARGRPPRVFEASVVVAPRQRRAGDGGRRPTSWRCVPDDDSRGRPSDLK